MLGMILKDQIQELMKARSFMIMVDTQLSEANGYLRSLHFLARISENALRRAVVWEPGRNCNKPLDTTGTNLEFIHPRVFCFSDLLHCIFVNDEKDGRYSYIDRYVEASIPSIVVVNRGKFIPKAWMWTGKPLESKSPFMPCGFEFEIDQFLTQNGLLDFQLRDTKNFAFTEINALHDAATSERAKTVVDLFDFDDERLSPSPIWDWAIALLRLRRENTVANMHVFLFNALRPLLERNKDVGAIASGFESFLKLHRNDEELVSENRKRKLKMGTDGWLRALQSIENSYIRSRLRLQLRRLGCL
jgi:hypothetical protein